MSDHCFVFVWSSMYVSFMRTICEENGFDYGHNMGSKQYFGSSVKNGGKVNIGLFNINKSI